MHFLSLKFPGFVWWWIPLVIGCIVLLYYTLKNSPSHEIRPARKILTVLRILIFIVLTGLILRPEIHWTSIRRITPTSLVFIDNSLSIASQEGFSTDSILTQAQKIGAALFVRGIKPQYFIFNEKIQPVSGKLKNIRFDGTATDIAGVLNYLKDRNKDENIVGAILLSDGVITRGEDPAFMDLDLSFPIITVGVGDSSQIMDPTITKIGLPPIARVGDTVTINVELIPTGNGEPLIIVLKDDDKIVQRKLIPSQVEALKKAVDFQIVPAESGEKNITAEIVTSQDRNPYNNLRMGSLKVSESRTRVLIISGQANFEARFLTQTLRELDDFEVQNIVENNHTWLPANFAQTIAKKWDLLIFIGYPTAQSASGDIINLCNQINNPGLPFILFINRNSDLRQLEKMLGWNPVPEYESNKNSEPIIVQCTREGENHPIIRYLQNSEILSEIWQTLPPIGMPFKKIRLASPFQNILESNAISENPVIAINSEMRRRLAICIGNDFWRWSFMTQGSTRENLYKRLFLGMSKWLVDTLSTSPIQFSLNKKVFLTGETIAIKGYLRDLKGDFINNARLKAETIAGDELIESGNLIWDGEGYSGSLPVNTPGECLVRISAWQDDELLGVREHKIMVVDRPVELMEIRQNAGLLRTIAWKSGGLKVGLDNLTVIANQFSPTRKIVRNEHILRILHWKWSFVLLLILLVMEWSIRRFHGYQ